MASGSEKAFGAINANRSSGNSAARRRGNNAGPVGQGRTVSRPAARRFDIF